MTLEEYIRATHGNGAKLARALGVSASRVSQMASDSSRIEPSRCLQIERATDGAVKRQDLRVDWSDIWPELAYPAACCNSKKAKPARAQ